MTLALRDVKVGPFWQQEDIGGTVVKLWVGEGRREKRSLFVEYPWNFHDSIPWNFHDFHVVFHDSMHYEWITTLVAKKWGSTGFVHDYIHGFVPANCVILSTLYMLLNICKDLGVDGIFHIQSTKLWHAIVALICFHIWVSMLPNLSRCQAQKRVEQT